MGFFRISLSFSICLLLWPLLPLLKSLGCSRRRKYWRKIAKRKKDESIRHLEDAYQTICLKYPIDQSIINLKGYEIIQKIKSEELKPSEVLAAYCVRTRDVGLNRLCAVTEDTFLEAIDSAVKMEKNLEAYKQLELTGVPISIKDTLNQKGCDSTCGIAACCFQPFEEDGLLIELLRDAGALPFIRANVPQMLMIAESSNLIFGSTRNPWDLKRTSGGSGGGDSALVAGRCTPIALGSDIGGSVRIPASFCGVYGFKPTVQRNTKLSTHNPRIHPQRFIDAAAGPLARSVKDLVSVMKSIWVPKLWEKDPCVCPLPFNECIFQNGSYDNHRLRIGVLMTDQFFQPCKASTRAILMAKESLDLKGFETEFIDLPENLNGWNVIKLYISVLFSEGDLSSFIDGLQGEDILPAYNQLVGVYKIPLFLRPFLVWLLKLKGDHRTAIIPQQLKKGGFSVKELNVILTQVIQFRIKFQEFMISKKLDAILLPATPLPAIQLGRVSNFNCCFSYMFFANLLEYPAGVVPVTCVQEDEQFYDYDSLPSNQQDKISREVPTVMEGSKGLPIGVQIMTLKYQDELCLHIMEKLEETFGDLTVNLKL